MSLGSTLVERLRAGERGVIEVDDGQVKVRAEVSGAGPFGSELRSLEVRPNEGGAVDGHEVCRRALRIEEEVTAGAERWRTHERDAGIGRAVLRTRPEDLRGGEYDEVWVEGDGAIRVDRYRFDRPSGTRERVGMNHGHHALERIVDGLGRIVGG